MPVALTGWNTDFVSENDKTPFSTPWAQGGARRSFFESGLQGHLDGLPSSREFASALDPAILFRLESYDTNNCLTLHDGTEPQRTGVLNLIRPAAYQKLYILAGSDQGSAYASLTLEFNDGTLSQPISVLARGWFAGTNSVTGDFPRRAAITNLGRNEYSGSGFTYYDGAGLGYELRQTDIDLAAHGLSGKLVSRLHIRRPSGAPESLFVMAVSGEPAEPNQALALDGNGSYVTVPNAPDLQNPTEITIEAWIYPQQIIQNNSAYINKGDNVNATSSRSYELQWVANADAAGPGQSVRFILFFNNGSWAFVQGPAAENTWVHVAGCFSSSTGLLQLFINGTLAETISDASGVPLKGTLVRQTTLPLRFARGDYSPYSYARGNMDEVRIWTVARTAEQIRESRFCRLSGAETNLAAYWNFDDGAATDLTGHGHNGTYSGNAHAEILTPGDPIHAGVCGPQPRFNVARSGLSSVRGFRFNLTPGAVTSAKVEASTNLLDWDTVVEFQDLSEPVEFIDPSATNFTRRFYRALQQP